MGKEVWGQRRRRRRRETISSLIILLTPGHPTRMDVRVSLAHPPSRPLSILLPSHSRFLSMCPPLPLPLPILLPFLLPNSTSFVASNFYADSRSPTRASLSSVISSPHSLPSRPVPTTHNLPLVPCHATTDVPTWGLWGWGR